MVEIKSPARDENAHTLEWYYNRVMRSNHARNTIMNDNAFRVLVPNIAGGDASVQHNLSGSSVPPPKPNRNS